MSAWDQKPIKKHISESKRQDGRLEPAHFLLNCKNFIEILQTVENKTTVLYKHEFHH